MYPQLKAVHVKSEANAYDMTAKGGTKGVSVKHLFRAGDFNVRLKDQLKGRDPQSLIVQFTPGKEYLLSLRGNGKDAINVDDQMYTITGTLALAEAL